MDRRATGRGGLAQGARSARSASSSITANRLDDHPVIVNLLWERSHRPDVFARIAKVLTIDGYVTFRLTGRATLTTRRRPSTVRLRHPPSPVRRRPARRAMDVDPALLPSLHACEAVVARSRPRRPRRRGLAAGTPVAGGQVDCNAGWLQGGAIEPGDIQMNLGTAATSASSTASATSSSRRRSAVSINFPCTVAGHLYHRAHHDHRRRHAALPARPASRRRSWPRNARPAWTPTTS